tara:strand:- start:96 stop:935 length:840 start_codon:yes stop_codon:yes gene_type:complete
MNTQSINARQEQIFTSIQNIQSVENDLYTLIGDLPTGMSSDEKQKTQTKIVNQIKDLHSIRKNMLNDLTDMFTNLSNSISTASMSANTQEKVTKIINNEYDYARKKYNYLNDEKNNKQRMTEINTYHGKKYNAHSNVMKILLISCILILILIYIKNKNILPNNIVALIIGIIIFYTGLRITLLIIDISRRDNMNYDKYNWDFIPPSDKKMPEYVEPAVDPDESPSSLNPSLCRGSDCCKDGTQYDTTEGVCKLPPKQPKDGHTYLDLHTHDDDVQHHSA